MIKPIIYSILLSALFYVTPIAHARQMALELNDLPSGSFRQQVETLPLRRQQEVLERLVELDIPGEDYDSLRVHKTGRIFYVCSFAGAELTALEPSAPVEPISSVVITGAVSTASPPVWHSRPGSANVLFLDFNGAVVSNTAWNSYPSYGMVDAWDCRPYSLDANDSTFSVAEQQAMRVIWERVAEDYAPFDIDVTTEEPAAWNSHTGHVLITPDVDKNGVDCPHNGSGGVAFVDVFGENAYSYDYTGECYSPAWVLNYELPGAAEFEAEAAAHEMGHNLALSHDGTRSSSYYGGHENGSISWGPIMGTGYNRNVSQWSKGDYRFSNNNEDDLAIISLRLSYRPDDAGNDHPSAMQLMTDSSGSVLQAGVIEQTLDIDVFSFSAVSGAVSIAASPYRDASSTTWGGDLDIVLELYDEEGGLLATDNPELETMASLSTVVSSGTYYLHIFSTGVGDPMDRTPSGYVRYGSLGQYALTGSIPVNPDQDADGLPDQWETAYFGAVALVDADGDDDFDSVNNLKEYIGGYDPTNAASRPIVQVLPGSSSNGVPYVLSWNAVSGRVYTVNWSGDLTNTFINISGDLPYPASSYTDSVERASVQQFYSIGVRLVE